LEAGTDGTAGVGEGVSEVVGDAAGGTADTAAGGAVVGTTENTEAGDDGMEPGLAIANAETGSVWTGLADDGWLAADPVAGIRPAWVLDSVRLLVRNTSVMF